MSYPTWDDVQTVAREHGCEVGTDTCGIQGCIVSMTKNVGGAEVYSEVVERHFSDPAGPLDLAVAADTERRAYQHAIWQMRLYEPEPPRPPETAPQAPGRKGQDDATEVTVYDVLCENGARYSTFDVMADIPIGKPVTCVRCDFPHTFTIGREDIVTRSRRAPKGDSSC